MRACSTDNIYTQATRMLYTSTMEMKPFLVPLFYCPWPNADSYVDINFTLVVNFESEASLD